MADVYGSQTNQTLPKYDALRKQFLQQSTAQRQQEEDAIKRRYAALGGLNSGSYIKQQQVASDQAAQRQDQGLTQIGAQEAEDQRQQAEVEKQRQFQTKEREAGQSFAADQTALQRKFAQEEAARQRDFTTGERVAGQQFQAQESAATRNQQASQFAQQFGLNQQMFESDRGIKLAQMDLAQREFDRDTQTNNWNMAMDAITSGADPSVIAATLERIRSGNYQLSSNSQYAPQTGTTPAAQTTTPAWTPPPGFEGWSQKDYLDFINNQIAIANGSG